jgi:archaellum component FlaC
MENIMVETTVNLGVELVKLAVKGTTTAVVKKVTAIKDEKNVEKIRSVYDEIVNELIQERDAAVLIAQSYKSELERVVISDEDIKHLHNTISRLIEIFKEISDNPEDLKIFEQLKELVNIDTLKTMQLLGFNYKAAIGEPLTTLCANAISSASSRKKQQSNNANGKKRN